MITKTASAAIAPHATATFWTTSVCGPEARTAPITSASWVIGTTTTRSSPALSTACLPRNASATGDPPRDGPSPAMRSRSSSYTAILVDPVQSLSSIESLRRTSAATATATALAWRSRSVRSAVSTYRHTPIASGTPNSATVSTEIHTARPTIRVRTLTSRPRHASHAPGSAPA